MKVKFSVDVLYGGGVAESWRKATLLPESVSGTWHKKREHPALD